MAFTTGNDLNILQSSDVSTVGAGLGDDVYIISTASLSENQKIIITDIDGANTIKFIGGVTIASSLSAATEVLLTLDNGAVIDILGADTFSYEIGGSPFSTGSGTVQTFSTFLTSSLGMTTVPTGVETATGTANLTTHTDGTVTDGTVTDGTVTDGSVSSEFSIATASVVEGNSGTTALNVTITRTGDSNSAASVNLSTADNTATKGTDYTEVSNQTINFASGETSVTFTISVIGDTTFEADEVLTAVLSSPSEGFTLKTGSSIALLTINNDDEESAIFTLSRDPSTTTEDNGINEVALSGINTLDYTDSEFGL